MCSAGVRIPSEAQLKFDKMKTNRSTVLALVVLAIIIGLAALTSCTGPKVVSGTRFIQTVNEPFTVPVNNAAFDTIPVNKSDGISGLFMLPNGTDTIKFNGGTRTYHGYPSGYISVPMTGLGLGYNDAMRLDSVSVIIKKGGLIFTPVK